MPATYTVRAENGRIIRTYDDLDDALRAASLNARWSPTVEDAAGTVIAHVQWTPCPT